MSKVAVGAAKRVVGDVVTRIFEMGDVVVGLGLHEAALAEPHVTLDREDITLKGGKLGLGPREGIAKVAHADNLHVQPWVAHGLRCVAKESVAHHGPEKKMAEPSRKGSDALTFLGVPGLSIDLEDPRVLAGGLAKIISENMAVLKLLDPMSDAETAIFCMGE
jgi:hypothetical protein